MTSGQLTALLKKMTNKQKLAQLTQLNPICFGFDCITPLTGPDFGLRMPDDARISVGSVLNCENAADMRRIQREHLERDPHHIPLLFMADIIHGFKTIFPIPLALGCSFSPDNMRESASIAAKESAASGVHVTFSPMADLVRDPRWGRVMESTGEDPYLNSLMSAAAVYGYQGDNPAKDGKLASCVKHFAAYGIPEGGREYNTVDLSDGVLQDVFLSSYQAALHAGARMVMTSFNIVNRIPATANKKLLRDLLRREWNFDGVIISDYNSVGELLYHGVAQNGAEAAEKSLAAGVDIEMMSTHYIENIEQLIETGIISQPLLDEAVLRVLTLKNDLGLFENPYKDADEDEERRIHLCDEHRAEARRIAQQCAVLLKNEKALPLGKSKKIGLAGPFACSRHVLGGWSAGSKEGVSIYEGLLEKLVPENIVLGATTELGSLLEGMKDIPAPESTLIEHFKDCETVIVAVGENQMDTGEGASKTNLRLSPNQELLIHRLKAAGKKIVTILFSGRPLEISPIVSASDAILQAWFLGTESGHALADLLVGDANPSGKLSMSFPVSVGQIPVYYNRNSTGRPAIQGNTGRYVSRYLDCSVAPLYCFGHGLSYSEYYYRDLTVSTQQGVSVSVVVENRSKVDGTETVQFYIRDLAAGVVRPIQELKAFQKIHLAPGESRTVTFMLTQDMLTFYGAEGPIFEPGEFELMIGSSSAQVLSAKLYIDEDLLKTT